MVRLYNYSNVLASFREYLIAGNMKSITCRAYLSDVSHFLGWYMSYFVKEQYSGFAKSHVNDGFILNPYFKDYVIIISSYANYLDKTAIISTKKRRLYAFKKFVLFCANKGLIYEEFLQPLLVSIASYIPSTNQVYSNTKNTSVNYSRSVS